MIIPAYPWAPDSAGVDSQVLAIAKNVLPLANGYGPIPSLTGAGGDTLTPATGGTLPAGCRGLTFARTAASGWVVFAGTATNLYKLNGSSWDDYTRVSGGNYNLATDDYWSFTQFGSQLVACHVGDDVQVLDVDSGASAFSALGGNPPRARYVNVVGDFLVLGALSFNSRKLRNSGLNDSTSWTVGTDLCDEQEFPDGGRITGLAGGEFGYVVQEKAVRRMIFQPGQDIAFRFERVDQEHGGVAGYSVIGTAGGVFFLATDGFYFFGPNGLIPIGSSRVNKWFENNSDTSRNFAVEGFVDVYGPRVFWAFYSSTSSPTFDRLLIYDWKLDKWAYAEVSAEFWATFATPGVTLESLDTFGDLDSGLIPFPLDSRVWEGGRPVVAAINTSRVLSFLEGTTPLDAQLRTSPIHLSPGRRSKVTDVYPMGVFNGATLGVSVGKREHTGQSTTWTPSVAPSTLSGWARMIASGRVHEIDLSITQSSGTTWTHAQGFDVSASPDGMK